MENHNETFTDFILLGLFPPSSLGLFLFTLTVPTFLMALTGNLSMVLLILLDAQLHTPMYFLLSQLSLMDLIYICTTVPKMASGFLFGNKSISFIGCGVQCFFFLTLGASEALLLMSMSYDRYVAICFPLHYPIHMNRRVCVLNAPLPKMASGFLFGNKSISFIGCGVQCFFFLTLGASEALLLMSMSYDPVTYGKVLLAVYHMHSREGRKKAYSTCSAHLTVVTFYYAPFAYTYLRPQSLHSPVEDKVLAVFYTILTPALNPLIYSLRNKEVLGALRRVTQSICSVKM
ncbi:olfactory receptor 2L3 [Fukomys damarensis]|uniref:Olfactory receptor n=1 Tax=Fukomys damarensis TaxID=885580 RepID=A0A091DXL9_FUKDA|nr:olfactory receptor 2L3 [Fukomys damarensis]KFO35822.1 Olfactory receptor 2L2 [Fukomys damarensis]